MVKISDRIKKLESLRSFIKHSIIIVLAVIILYIIWCVVLNNKFSTDDYTDDDISKVSSVCVGVDIKNASPTLKRGNLCYLIKLSDGKVMYFPEFIRKELFDEEKFENNALHTEVTIEYAPEETYSFFEDYNKFIDAYMLVSLKGSDGTVYIDRSDCIREFERVKNEYHLAYLVVVALGVFLLILSGAWAFTDIKREIELGRKRKIKREKRDAYRKKHGIK